MELVVKWAVTSGGNSDVMVLVAEGGCRGYGEVTTVFTHAMGTNNTITTMSRHCYRYRCGNDLGTKCTQDE
jgi:hypothetical protein